MKKYVIVIAFHYNPINGKPKVFDEFMGVDSLEPEYANKLVEKICDQLPTMFLRPNEKTSDDGSWKFEWKILPTESASGPHSGVSIETFTSLLTLAFNTRFNKGY